MHLLVKADRAWSPFYARPNPLSPWDWCPLPDVDPFNDMVLAVTGDRDVGPVLFIEAGVRGENVFAIDGVSKDVQWMYARDALGGVLNSNGGP